MRKNLLFFTVVSILITVAAGCAKAASKIEALNEPWSFGEIEKGALATKAFYIKNGGDSELIINRIQACCGYGVVDMSLWKIMPGEKAELVISSDTSRKPVGEDQKAVTISSNDPVNPEIKIPVRSTVKASEQVELPAEGSGETEEEISEDISDENMAGESE
jgi:hypothetical protein